MRVFFHHIFISLLLLSLVRVSFAQENSSLPFQSPKAQRTLKEIYNFQFDRVKATLMQSQSGISEEDAALLQIFKLKWQYKPLHDQPEPIQNLYLQKLEDCKATMENESATLSELEQIFTNMSFAEFYFNKRSYFKALSYGSSAYGLMKKHITENPQSATDYFISGIYLYYRDYYAAHNKLFASMLFFFPNGNQALGKKFLEECLSKGTFLQTEALIVLTHLHLYLDNKPEQALPYVSKLTSHYPGNLKFQELYAVALLSAKRHEAATEAIQLLQGAHTSYYREKGKILAAIALEQSGLSGAALNRYQQLITEVKALPGDHFQWESLLYAGLARIYKAQQQNEKAERYAQLCEKRRTYTFNLTKTD